MRLLYATSINVPSTRANRLQIMSMAQAFHQILKENFLLGLHTKVQDHVVSVPHVEIDETRSYFLAWKYLQLANRGQFTHIYCREEKLLFFVLVYNTLFFRLPLYFCYEIHHLWYMNVVWYRYVLHHVNHIVSITQGMKDILVGAGYSEQKVSVAPDAVNLAMFDIDLSKEESREKFVLPKEKKIVLYTGTIDEPWKGVGVLYEAMKQLGEEYYCVIVGGKPHYVEEFDRLYPPIPNMLLVGHKPHIEIPVYLKASDVVVLPNSAKNEVSRISTSPMKLFEYMASGRPIVASDLPSIREVVDEESATLVAPDDAAALAAGIRKSFENISYASALAQKAREKVALSTWERRASSILHSMELSYAKSV